MADPNKVVVVFRNNNAAQPAEKHQAIPIQIVLGEHAGEPVSEWKSMGAGSPAESGLTGKEKFAAEFVTTSPITFVPREGAAESFAKTKGDGVSGIGHGQERDADAGTARSAQITPGFKIIFLTASQARIPSNVLVIAATHHRTLTRARAGGRRPSVYRIGSATTPVRPVSVPRGPRRQTEAVSSRKATIAIARRAAAPCGGTRAR